LNDPSFLKFLNELYSRNDTEDYVRAFQQLLDKLAAAVANVVDLLGRETIVLNSRNPFFSDKAVDYLRKRVFDMSLGHTELKMMILKVTEQKLLRTPLAVSIGRILGVF
jgi:hypothetical protein